MGSSSPNRAENKKSSWNHHLEMLQLNMDQLFLLPSQSLAGLLQPKTENASVWFFGCLNLHNGGVLKQMKTASNSTRTQLSSEHSQELGRFWSAKKHDSDARGNSHPDTDQLHLVAKSYGETKMVRKMPTRRLPIVALITLTSSSWSPWSRWWSLSGATWHREIGVLLSTENGLTSW